MIARFSYCIPRHHGKYGTAVAVFGSREEMLSGMPWAAYYKTYRFQDPGDGRVCDGGKQVEVLKAKVLRNFPGCEFINL